MVDNCASYLRQHLFVMNHFRFDAQISAALTAKFPLQCTALEARQVPLAFFSDLVDDDEKAAMAATLVGIEKPPFEPVISVKPNLKVDLGGKRLRDFVGPQSWFLFRLIGAGDDWLMTDPATWNDHPQYVAMKTIVRAMPGVNDMSERDCRLAEDFKVQISYSKSSQIQSEHLLTMLHFSSKEFGPLDPKKRTGMLYGIAHMRKKFPSTLRSCLFPQ